MDMYTMLYLKQITNKSLLYSTWNSAQCYVAAWMGEEFEGEWIRVYLCLESICCSPKTIYITLFLSIGCTPTQNKVFFKYTYSYSYNKFIVN